MQAKSLGIFWCLCMLAASGVAAAGEQSAFTVEDSIGMTHFAGMDHDYLGERTRIRQSPDGRHVLVLTRTGRLAENVNEFVLWLYRMDEIDAALSGESPARAQPIEVARFKSSSNAEAIRLVTWDAAGRSVFFVAEGSDGVAQLYRYEVDRESARMEKMTDEPLGVRTYSANNRAIVYSARLPRSASRKEQLLQSESFVLPHDWRGFELLNPRALDHPILVDHAGTFVRRSTAGGSPAAQRIRVAEDLHGVSDSNLKYWLSPDGRHAVVVRASKSVPESWERYAADPLLPNRRIRSGDSQSALTHSTRSST